jgi:hypothetical protein
MPVDLDDLVAPPPAPGFRERLWERAAERDRVVSRRWRAAAIGATAVATAAVSAAGVLAFGSGTSAGPKTFDATRSCPVAVQGGIPVARLQAHSTSSRLNNGQMFRLVAFAGFTDSAGHSLGGIGQAAHGYGFPEGTCSRAPAIPLTRSGLPLYDVFKPGDDGFGAWDNGVACWTAARMTVRIHVNVDKNDVPTTGTIVMRTGKKKLRPVVYIEWAAKRVAVYMSDDCHA